LKASLNRELQLAWGVIIRLAVKSKWKGKSGGMRVITFVVTKRKELFLLSIYDKADKDTLSDKEILALIPDLH